MRTTASDLSPFYLAQARANVRYWKSMRAAERDDLGGTDGTGTDYMQCAAEQVSAPDAGYDIVSAFVTTIAVPITLFVWLLMQPVVPIYVVIAVLQQVFLRYNLMHVFLHMLRRGELHMT